MAPLLPAIVSPLLLAGPACRVVPAHLELFYRPAGTAVEIYKARPVPLELMAYPAPPVPARGAVLFIHGGGWSVRGAGVPTYQDWHEALRSAGLRAFALEHRVPPEYRGRDQIEDCIDAVRYLRTHATRLGIPRDRLALVGYSSGGHLAVMTALTLTRPRPGLPIPAAGAAIRAVVAYYAPLDPERLLGDTDNAELRAVLENYLPPFRDDPALRESFYRRALTDVSPLRHLHAQAPPIMLLHGTRDRLIPVEQSRVFRDRAELIRPGLVRLREVPQGDHHFIVSRSRWARQADREALEFIRARIDARAGNPLPGTSGSP